jgi:hypothetical protein
MRKMSNLIIRKMQIRTAMKCFSPIGLTDNKRIANTAHRNVSKKRHARTLSMSWRTSEARDT